MRCMLLLFACLTPCWSTSITAQRPLPAAIDAIDLRITDDLGGPIQNARITLRGYVEGSQRYRVLDGQARRQLEPKDFNGDYARLANLPEGEFVWFVEADGFALAVSKTFTLPSKKVTRLNVRMQSGATLTGRVTGPDGAPVANAMVATGGQIDRNQQPFLVMMARMMIDPVTIAQTKTAADGSYLITNVAAGKYRITAQHADFAPADCDLTVKGGGSHKVAAVRMPAGTVVSGIVTLDNKRVPNAVVVLQSYVKTSAKAIPHLDVYMTITADQDGQFRLPRVVPGRYQLAAHEPGEPIAMAMQIANSTRVVEVVPKATDETQTELIVLKR